MRKLFAGFVVAAASLAGREAASDPPKQVQDVEFLRGCWVEKPGLNGSDVTFLRLLPTGPDGRFYEGYLQQVKGAETFTPFYVVFARDGSSLTLRKPGRDGPIMPLDPEGGAGRPYAPLPAAIEAKLPKAEHRASYAVYGGRATTPYFVADGGKDTLAISAIGNTGENMGDLFRGERDGCD